MQKQKENLFSEIFCLLNSQESTGEINWSSSESSEFENGNSERFCKLTNKVHNRKRKRKKKVPKNISNLDITIIDVPKDQKEVPCRDKSPIIDVKTECKSLDTSPVFAPTPLYFPTYKCSKITNSSPILTSKGCSQQIKPKLPVKSPILVPKYASPKATLKVRKNLFSPEAHIHDTSVTKAEQVKRESPVNRKVSKHIGSLKASLSYNNLDRSKANTKNRKSNSESININHSSSKIIETSYSPQKTEANSTINIVLQDNLKTEDLALSENNFDRPKSSLELAKKIKAYFDSHFTSESTSQHSINDSPTPKHSSKSSGDIEVVTITQVNSSKISSPLDQELFSKNISPTSSESAEMNCEMSKKIRYKKYGLAYRFNQLLKKQNANISLWQHERFLAENSSFMIPKGEHVVFRIQKVNFKYGCYLLEAVNVEDEEFLLLVSDKHVYNNNLSSDMILKLYEPYKMLDYNSNCKLIINACKFECIPFK